MLELYIKYDEHKKHKYNKHTTGCRTLKSYCKKRSIDGKIDMIKGQSQN